MGIPSQEKVYNPKGGELVGIIGKEKTKLTFNPKAKTLKDMFFKKKIVYSGIGKRPGAEVGIPSERQIAIQRFQQKQRAAYKRKTVLDIQPSYKYPTSSSFSQIYSTL